MSDGVLPSTAGLSIVGEVGANPLVDLGEGHPAAWGGVDGEGDEGGVAVGGLAIPWMLLRLRLLPFRWKTRLPTTPTSCGHALSTALLQRCPHAQLRQPVHGRQAALQLGRHSNAVKSNRRKGSGEGPNGLWAGSKGSYCATVAQQPQRLWSLQLGMSSTEK